MKGDSRNETQKKAGYDPEADGCENLSLAYIFIPPVLIW